MIYFGLVAVYLFAGVFIAAPYIFLASGGIVDFCLITIFGPIVVFFLSILLSAGKTDKCALKTSIYLIAYFLSPIIFVFLSMVFQFIGLNEIATQLFTARYWILWVFALLFLLAMAVDYFKARHQGRNKLLLMKRKM